MLSCNHLVVSDVDCDLSGAQVASCAGDVKAKRP